jgi:SAM-dependent methyltransferase
MTQYSDPFVEAFHDYLNGETGEELAIYVNNEFSENMPVRYFFRGYDEMPQLEQIALKECKGKILDIGAGAGCHSMILQNRGYDITALDIKKGFVDIMKQRGIEKIVHSDIFNFKEGKFDTLLMLMNGIGFTIDFIGLERFLNQAKDLLNPDGHILLDSSDLLYLFQEEDGSFKVPLTGDYYGKVIYQVEYKNRKGEPFDWIFIDYSTLMQYAEKTGYDCELLFANDFHYLAKLTIV